MMLTHSSLRPIIYVGRRLMVSSLSDFLSAFVGKVTKSSVHVIFQF